MNDLDRVRLLEWHLGDKHSDIPSSLDYEERHALGHKGAIEERELAHVAYYTRREGEA